eukprot:8469420-Lingulodinium_polyedra.AAC.1
MVSVQPAVVQSAIISAGGIAAATVQCSTLKPGRLATIRSARGSRARVSAFGEIPNLRWFVRGQDP